MAAETEVLKNYRKEKIGIVIRAKTPKTIVVETQRLVQHPLYKKVIRKRKRYMVHDEAGKAKVGDRVRMVEYRPISKTKSWRLSQVLKV